MAVTVRHTYIVEQKVSKKNWTLTVRDSGKETWAGSRRKEHSSKCDFHCIQVVAINEVDVFYSSHSNLSILPFFSHHLRDDRCVGDNGREGWYPYLAEEVVSLLQSLPIEHVRHTHLHLEQRHFIISSCYDGFLLTGIESKNLNFTTR